MITGIQYLKDCLGILPFLILTFSGIIILLGTAGSNVGNREKFGSGVAIAGCVFSMLCLILFRYPANKVLFNGMLYVDNFSVFLIFMLLIATLIVVLISRNAITYEGIGIGEYYALLVFSTAGMILMVQAAHLIMVFLALEIFSIAIYILVGLAKHKPISVESSLKYFLLGAFAAAFFLYGLTYIYGATGTLELANIAKVVTTGGITNKFYLLAGATLVLFGLGFKIALVPFHMWTPDVYQGAPTSITAYMAVGVKAPAFAVFIRIFGQTLMQLSVDWNTIFWILAILTMTVGNICALLQDSVKRMLAYSSIAHAGYIFVAIVAGSEFGWASILYYLLVYTFMNLGAFGVVIYIEHFLGQKDDYKSFTGFGFKKPVVGLCMTIFLCSLMGLPPTGGFFAKFMVFSSAVKAGYIWLVILGVLNSAVAAYYYLRLIITMYTRPEESLVLKSQPGVTYNTVGLILSVIGTLMLGVIPYSFLELAMKAVSL